MKKFALVAVFLASTFVGCGGSGSDQTISHPIPTVTMSKAEVAKLPPLRIPRPTGSPPHRLEVVDLRKGSGPGVTTMDDVVSSRYIEDSYPEARSGRQGGLSGGEIAPPSFRLAEPPFRSFRTGLLGMKVGGRRELIVPPKVAYPRWKPSWGYAPYVSIYVVDLLGVKPPAGSGG